MRIDWDTPVDVLMHGENIRYIDLDEDEIVHFKYIKREKLPNGKYRYYYDESAFTDSIAVKDYEIKRGKQLEAVTQYVADNEAARKAMQPYATTPEEANRLVKKAHYSKLKMYEAERRAEKAYRVYRKAQISTFPARVISKGIVKVANFFSGLFDKQK